jgi:dihydrofolate synthase/folylpolyglutamate synthase
VFAALGDKDVHGVARAMEARIDSWFLAGLQAAGPRGGSVDALAGKLADTAAATGSRHADVATALAAARAQARSGDRILVFGSFHTVAAALHALDHRDDSEAGETPAV